MGKVRQRNGAANPEGYQPVLGRRGAAGKNVGGKGNNNYDRNDDQALKDKWVCWTCDCINRGIGSCPGCRRTAPDWVWNLVDQGSRPKGGKSNGGKSGAKGSPTAAKGGKGAPTGGGGKGAGSDKSGTNTSKGSGKGKSGGKGGGKNGDGGGKGGKGPSDNAAKKFNAEAQAKIDELEAKVAKLQGQGEAGGRKSKEQPVEEEEEDPGMAPGDVPEILGQQVRDHEQRVKEARATYKSVFNWVHPDAEGKTQSVDEDEQMEHSVLGPMLAAFQRAEKALHAICLERRQSQPVAVQLRAARRRLKESQDKVERNKEARAAQKKKLEELAEATAWHTAEMDRLDGVISDQSAAIETFQGQVEELEEEDEEDDEDEEDEGEATIPAAGAAQREVGDDELLQLLQKRPHLREKLMRQTAAIVQGEGAGPAKRGRQGLPLPETAAGAAGGAAAEMAVDAAGSDDLAAAGDGSNASA